MKRLRWLCGIVLCSQIVGCAGLSLPTYTAHDRVDTLLHQREYREALAVVAELQASPSPPMENVRALGEKVQSHIAGYEQQVMAEADRAVAAQEWSTAFDLFRDALDRVPDSRRLQEGQQHLRRLHAEHLESLELERLIAKGEWTLRDLATSRVAEAAHAGNWLSRYWLDRKTAGAQRLALELATHGKRALERKDLSLAKRTLPLALNLSSTTEIRALNTQLRETLAAEELRNLSARRRIAGAASVPQPTRVEQHPTPELPPRLEQAPKEEHAPIQSQEQNGVKRLLAEFRKACEEKNFAEAQHLKSQLEQHGVKSQEFEKLSKQLTADIAKHAKHLIDIGATHYSQQRYQEALEVWKHAQALEPKNEQLAARIKRVTRVLDKLQALRNKNPPVQ